MFFFPFLFSKAEILYHELILTSIAFLIFSIEEKVLETQFKKKKTQNFLLSLNSLKMVSTHNVL